MFIEKFASRDSRWDNLCNKTIFRVMQNGEDFPTEDEINKLVKYTESAFNNSPFMSHAMDRVFSIRRRWLNQNNKRLKKDKEQERNIMEEQIAMQDEVAASIKDVITKIARENNIAAADAVNIKMSADEGIIIFKEVDKIAKPLTTEARKDLPKSEFVFPEEERYPIDTKNRAQNALARIEQHGTPAEKSQVKSKVKKEYPDMEIK